MTRSSSILHASFLIAALAACSRSESKPTQNKPVEEVVAPAAVDPKTIFEQSGDKLVAEGDGPSALTWHGVMLAVVQRGDEIMIRAYGAAGATDVSKRMPPGDLDNELELAENGAAVLFHSSSLSGRVEGVGALLAYDYTRIVWDAGKLAPVVRETWSCDETDTPNGICNLPAWAGGTGTPAAAKPPTAAEAAEVMKAWLMAISDGDTSTAPALMSDTFVLVGNQELRGPRACPTGGPLMATTKAQRRQAAQCTYDVLSPEVAYLAKKAVPTRVQTEWPETEGSWPDESDPDVASLLAAGPAGSLAFVPVYKTSGGIEWGAVGVVANVDGGARLVGVYVVAPLLGG
jgi:hypothetical protein